MGQKPRKRNNNTQQQGVAGQKNGIKSVEYSVKKRKDETNWVIWLILLYTEVEYALYEYINVLLTQKNINIREHI